MPLLVKCGIVSWEVNAAFDLWSKTNIGNLSDFLSLNWRTQEVESNTARWRENLAHKTMFEGMPTKGAPAIFNGFGRCSFISWNSARIWMRT